MKSGFLAFWLSGLVTLSACGTSEAQTLADHYDRFADNASPRSQCVESKKVAEAFAREGDEKKHELWKLISDTDCIHADAVETSDAG